MKRSSCLSAMLVGLSLTVASAAFAAPPAKAGKGTKKAKTPAAAPAKTEAAPTTAPAEDAVVQPADPPPPEGGGTPAPAPTDSTAAPTDAAPATGVPETTQPAISLGGTTTPGADTPGASAEEPKKKPPVRRWAGSQIINYTTMSTATFVKGQQQDYNPSVDTSFWLMPRFAISESFQLRGLLVFNYEFTNSDTTQTRNEPRFSDTLLSLWYRKIPVIPGVGIKPMVSLSLGLPTSPESRARTVLFNPGFGVQLVKEFEHVLGGEVMIIAGGSYSHPVYRSETPEVRGDFPYQRATVGPDPSAGNTQLSGISNASDQVLGTLVLTGEWGKWSPGIFFRSTHQFTYRPKQIDGVQQGNNTLPLSNTQNFNATNIRQLSFFNFFLDYNVNSFFTTEVGYWMSRPILDEDGQVGNPFFDRHQDMRVYLGLNLNVDNLMKTLEGAGGDAGIVRAKNTRGPAITWF